MTAHRARDLAAATVLPLVAALAVTTLGTPADAGTTEPRTVSITAVEPRDDVFLVKGKVRPHHPGGRVLVQRKRPQAAHWQKWRTVRTTDASRYRRRVRQLRRPGVICYRVKVPGDATYADAFSEKVCIRTYWK
ncbi:hypothetical protein [Nocardioides coralli]|uniref:hypothetical protein n=1 Tax=Nocardioides coralli TaxID=2872154 RepID=UPI001CA3BEE4|nr:hypothetical protein [Nocardioides coralli]QZY30543.1 hypothetical protein K6T13_07830 [Nocardioides coralli]